MPRDGAATKQRILDAAERLVIENGYAATSLDEVIAESGTSKGAFFHHFASKLDLASSLVDRYAAADITHLEQAATRAQAASNDPCERVIAFVRVFEDSADELMAAQSSCLYVSILTERQLARSGTSEQIVQAIEAWRHTLSGMLREALGTLPNKPRDQHRSPGRPRLRHLRGRVHPVPINRRQRSHARPAHRAQTAPRTPPGRPARMSSRW